MLKINFQKIFVLLAFLIFFCIFNVNAEDISGSEILKKIEESRQADTAAMKMTMELYNKSGDMRNRELRNRHKEGDIEKSLIEFMAPADVEGTAFLSLEEKENDTEDMYLYLPVLASVRKISGSQKNGNFVGSDLSYNDLTVFSGSNYIDNYDAEIIKKLEDGYLLKLLPIDSDIDYSFGKMWVREDIWSPYKIEFYDQSEELLKSINLEQFENISGNWVAKLVTVKNEQKGSKTILKIYEVEFNIQLDDQIFTTRYLER